MKSRKAILKKIYNKLLKTFGPQHWWPGDTPFEIIVGAILTQNTNWGNVEKAIHNLKQNKSLSFNALHKISHRKLAFLIKPAGYFNVKAKRLKHFMDFLHEEYRGSIKRMAGQAREDGTLLRSKLLGVNGVGPETADSILLYALNKPVFVVDAYTKRVFSRHHIIPETADYHDIQQIFTKDLETDVRLFNEYHALIVRIGKDYCKPKPRCAICPLNHKKFYAT